MSISNKVQLTVLMLITAACSQEDAGAQELLARGDVSCAPPPADAGQTVQTVTEQVTLGPLTFEVVTAGPRTGTPVVLLHGFPENADEWRHQVPVLVGAGYRVIVPNQRGYSAGARPPEVTAYAVPELVKDVLSIADALAAPRFHLVGHDWGASVAWAVALTEPARLLSVTPISVPHPDAFARVLSDPSSCQPQASSYFGLFTSPAAEATLLANQAQMLRSFYGGLPAATIDSYVAFFSGPALTGGLNWYRANLGARPAAGSTPAGPRAPRKVSVPTLYVWSDGDTALCRDGAVLTKDYVSGPYRFEVLEGVNHWVPELAAERLNALLLEHLSAHPSGI